jgi:hypothetical protein
MEYTSSAIPQLLQPDLYSDVGPETVSRRRPLKTAVVTVYELARSTKLVHERGFTRTAAGLHKPFTSFSLVQL